MRFRNEAAAVCRAMGAARSNSANGLIQAREAVGNLFVYYVGHGEASDDRADDPVLMPQPDRPVRLVGDLFRPGGERGWTLVAANACETGRADLRGATPGQAHVLLAAGYQRVAIQPLGVASTSGFVNRFGELITAALSGAADTTPTGNCDGIVSSPELATYLEDRLADPNAPAVEVRGGRAPIVVLKSDVAWPVPLLRLPAGSSCPEAERPAARLRALEARRLLGADETARVLGWRRQWEGGVTGTLPVGPRPRILILIGPDPETVSLGRALAALPGPATPELVLVWPEVVPLAEIHEVWRVADFAEVWGVRLPDRGSGRGWLAVVNGADGATLRVGDLAAPSAERLRLLLPRPLQLFDLPGAAAPVGPPECPTRSVGQRFLFTEVHGPVPRAARASNASGDAVVLSLEAENADPVACPRGRGQCFRVVNPDCRPRPAADYVLEEVVR